MKEIVDEIASLIDSEVSEASDWLVQKHSPIWRNPEQGKTLYIYGTRRFPGEFRTTGTREDIYEIVVELMEPANQEDLAREEEGELAFQSSVDLLVAWADSHQNLGDVAHRLDYVSLSYQDDLRREMMVRYARMTLHARANQVYT